jgi:hypothetical protein
MVVVTAVFGFVAMVFGAAAVHWGYRRRRYGDVVTRTPRRTVGDVSEPGFVHLEGEVTPVDGDDEPSVSAPFSGDACVVAGWRVADWDERGGTESWRRVAEGYESVAFDLDDGFGTIRVDPGHGTNDGRYESVGRFGNGVVVDDANVDLGRFRREHRIAPGEDRPSRVREFETEARAVPEQSGSVTNAVDVGTAHGERRYREATVEYGDSVSVLGRVESVDGNAGARRLRPADAVVRPIDDGPFVLSVRSRDELRDLTRWWLPAVVAGAGLVCWGAFSLYTVLPVG